MPGTKNLKLVWGFAATQSQKAKLTAIKTQLQADTDFTGITLNFAETADTQSKNKIICDWDFELTANQDKKLQGIKTQLGADPEFAGITLDWIGKRPNDRG